MTKFIIARPALIRSRRSVGVMGMNFDSPGSRPARDRPADRLFAEQQLRVPLEHLLEQRLVALVALNREGLAKILRRLNFLGVVLTAIARRSVVGQKALKDPGLRRPRIGNGLVPGLQQRR